MFISTVNPNAAVAEPEVIGNQELVRYEGSGGLILPESIDSATRRLVSECRGCSWKMTPACIPGPGNYCDALIRSCPGLIDHVRTWFRPEGGDWVETGLICLTSYRITTVAEADQAVRSSFEQYVPELRPQCWPRRGIVAQIPVICSSGQSNNVHTWRHGLAGRDVVVSAQPRWLWDFSGTRVNSALPGGPYPDFSVSHTFETHGVADVRVESVWTGTFMVGDLGPFEVREDLRQHKAWRVDVGEARGRLVRPD